MSRDSFLRDLKHDGAYILSDGTHNLQHLLAKAYDFIRSNKLSAPGSMVEDIRECFEYAENFSFGHASVGLFEAQYYGRAKLKQTTAVRDLAGYLWNETLYHFFNKLAPDNFYFGTSEGDGACFGWFKFDDEEDAV